MVAEPGSYPRLGWIGLWLRRKKLFLILVLLLLTTSSAMEERLRLLKEAWRQTMTALQDSQNRVTALEGGAGFNVHFAYGKRTANKLRDDLKPTVTILIASPA